MDDTNLDEIMEGDIKNFSDNISEKITNFKDEVSDEIISEFNKLPQLNVESNVVQKKKEFVFRDISWKTYRAASIGIIFISMFMANYIKIVAESKFADPYLKMILNIILLFFIINLGIFLFYKTYFKYISEKKGAKGLPGKRGKQGIPGENDMCDISKKKTANFRREKGTSKKEKIIEPDNTVLDIKEIKNSKKGWYNIDTESKNNADKFFNKGGKLSNKIIGINCKKCNSNSNSIYNKTAEKPKLITNPVNSGETVSINNKPIIGVNVNYNKNTNKIAALQYLYDKNKTHNPKTHNVGIFGFSNNNNDSTIGDSTNQTTGIEKLNFTCPPNSAIYKVEGSYDNMGLRGAKFHCQDIKTGKLVKAYDNNNKKMYGVNFGIEPQPDDENYHYNKSECSMFQNGNDFYPTFISNIGGEYDSEKGNIQNLRFNKCSFYNNK